MNNNATNYNDLSDIEIFELANVLNSGLYIAQQNNFPEETISFLIKKGNIVLRQGKVNIKDIKGYCVAQPTNPINHLQRLY